MPKLYLMMAKFCKVSAGTMGINAVLSYIRDQYFKAE